MQQSIKLAEVSGRPYDVIRSARALAETLIYIGRFAEAASWSSWALQAFDNKELKDGAGRLRLLQVSATARIFTGNTSGLRDLLLEAKDASDSAELGVAADIRAVLANLELVLGNFSEAEQLATENFEHSPRWRLGDLAVPLVRILLEQGKVNEALSRAQYAVTLTAEEDEFISLPASLALGMVYTLIKPNDAPSYLLKVFEAADIEASFRSTAALHLIKLGVLRFIDLDSEMQELLRTLSPTGFRLFCGPKDAFGGVWNTLSAQHVPLRIKVLGQEEVRLNDERLELSERSP